MQPRRRLLDQDGEQMPPTPIENDGAKCLGLQVLKQEVLDNKELFCQWQTEQNGHLKDIKAEILSLRNYFKKLLFGVIGALGAVALGLFGYIIGSLLSAC